MLTLLDAIPGSSFPDPAHAEDNPNGLLAVGGDLSTPRLLEAYRSGIFPWFNAGQPILWWSPDPRMVLRPEWLKVSRSLRKTLRRGHFHVSTDQAFGRVINACAAPRAYAEDTWIVPKMVVAYEALHAKGYAHSVETWQGERLVGGLYGVSIGCMFFGESMFSLATDASKAALVHLVETLERRGIDLIDCQIRNDHLASLGAQEMRRSEFLRELSARVGRACRIDWRQPAQCTDRLRAAN